MTQFPTLYLNENVALRSIELLGQLGIKAIHTLRVGNKGIYDEPQLEYAASHRYILVTHNKKHFKRLHQRWLAMNKEHPGIIIMSQSEPERNVKRIRLFFDKVYPLIQPPFCLAPPRLPDTP